jgi:hypothetical protein
MIKQKDFAFNLMDNEFKKYVSEHDMETHFAAYLNDETREKVVDTIKEFMSVPDWWSELTNKEIIEKVSVSEAKESLETILEQTARLDKQILKEKEALKAEGTVLGGDEDASILTPKVFSGQFNSTYDSFIEKIMKDTKKQVTKHWLSLLVKPKNTVSTQTSEINQVVVALEKEIVKLYDSLGEKEIREDKLKKELEKRK